MTIMAPAAADATTNDRRQLKAYALNAVWGGGGRPPHTGEQINPPPPRAPPNPHPPLQNYAIAQNGGVGGLPPHPIR